MLGLSSNLTTQELDHLIGLKQPLQQTLGDLTNSLKLQAQYHSHLKNSHRWSNGATDNTVNI